MRFRHMGLAAVLVAASVALYANVATAQTSSRANQALRNSLQSEVIAQRSVLNRLCTRLTRSALFQNSLPAFCTPAPPPPQNVSVSLSANPGQVNAGSNTTLTWQSSGATLCTAQGGWSGAKALSGSQSVAVATTTAFSISCGNSGATSTAQVTVLAIGSTPPSGSPLFIGPSATPLSQNVSPNVSNTALGGFIVSVPTEPLAVDGMSFRVATDTASVGLLTNVSIIDGSGTVIAGPVDAQWQNGFETLNFTDAVNFPVGTTTYAVRGKIPAAAGKGAHLTLSTDPSSTWANPRGANSHNPISLSAFGNFDLNTMTILTGSLAISASPNPPNRTILAGQSTVEMADIVLDTSGSGEDIRMTSIPLSFASTAPGDLNTCQLYNGATALNTGSNVAPAYSTTQPNVFSFDDSLTIPKNTQLTLILKCNIISGATSSYTWGVNAAYSYIASGVQSGNTVTPSVTTGASGTQTVAPSGSLTFSVDPSSPLPSLAFGGSQGNLIGIYKLRATNGPANVTDLGFRIINSSSSSKATGDGLPSQAATDIIGLHICTDSACATQTGTLTFVNSSTGDISATSTLSSNGITVTPGTDTLVYAKADLANIGTQQVGGIGDFLKVDPSYARGTSGGSTLIPAGIGQTAGIQIFRGFPMLAAGPAAPINQSGTNVTIKKFSITASSSGNGVAIYQIPMTIATSAARVSNLKMFVFTGSDYGTGPVNGIGFAGQFGVLSGTTAAVLCSAGCANNQILNFYAASSSPVYIPAGQTRYFKLTGTVTPDQGASNWSEVATIPGTSLPLTGLTSGYNVATSTAKGFKPSDFIWSDVATTSAVSTDVDWTNGYLVPGLAASGL